MLQSLRQTVSSSGSALAMWMMISVVMLFVGLTIVTKMESKFGYVVSAAGIALGFFVLKANRIF